MEKRLRNIYSKSYDGISEKWQKYMKESEKKLAPLQEAYDEAKRAGDKDLIKSTGINLSKAKKEQTLYNDYYKEMIDETTTRLARVNRDAVAYLNGELPPVFIENYNQAAIDADKVGVAFNLVDENTVAKMIRDDDITLPTKDLDLIKDKGWNTKKINSQVLQGILQGESMDKIAMRLQNVMHDNENSAIRNARTMVTGAENAGRQASYKILELQGAVMTKVWIATGDSRTRESHLELDGEEVGIDETFSNDLEYPGDPSGDYADFMNCRCSMRSHIIGFRRADGSIERIEYDRDETMHDKQIEKEKEKRAEQAKEKEDTKKVAAKNKSAKDLSEHMQTVVYNYTDGEYKHLCDYSQYIVNGDKDIPPSRSVSTKKWFEDNRLPDITEQERKDAMELLETINNQTIDETPLVRLERSDERFIDAIESGDTVEFGLRSASQDAQFVEKTISGDTEGFDHDYFGRENNGMWIEYRFESSRGIDVSEISAYPEQRETIIAGKYRVKNVEEIEPVKRGYVYEDVKVSEHATDVTYFTSKSGNEMVRYTFDGSERVDTVQKFNTRISSIERYRKGVFGRKIIVLEAI